MRQLLRKLMNKKTNAKINPELIVNPAPREVAYFSYRGLAVAVNINDSTIDEVFDTAKASLKAAMDREEIIDDRNQGKDRAREEVRTKNTKRRAGATKPVARKRKTGKVAPVLPGPEKSDIR